VKLVALSRWLSGKVEALTFGPPITHWYNPLDYAAVPHEAYLKKWGSAPKEALLLGMNPGPFGMAQTGVPFGDVACVRDWLGIDAPVRKPAHEHPARPITGFACPRSEVSGTRLWGWAKERFETPEAFFARFFVVNYCPLVFMEASGKNVTPDKLPKVEREALYAVCDEALRRAVAELQPRWLIGVGGFARKRAEVAMQGVTAPPRVAEILHPSPASPAANRGWARQVTDQLDALGL